MFNKNIVVVTGAGASCEYGLPLGAKLKATIADSLQFKFEFGRLTSGSSEISNSIRRSFKGNEEPYYRAGNSLAKAIPAFISIDESLHFLSSSAEAKYVGKLAIAHHILTAEKESPLCRSLDGGRPTLPSAASWIDLLFSMMVAGVKKENLPSAFRNLTIINFNYDRTIDHFIYWALQLYCELRPADAAEIVTGLNIIRPYGSLGNLEWHRSGGVPFGGGYSGNELSNFVSSIRTYTEQEMMDCGEIISDSLNASAMIIFLGFGFHAQNSDILRATNKKRRVKIIGTCKNIDHGNLVSIRTRLADNISTPFSDVALVDTTATELLHNLRPMILAEMQ